VRRGAGSIVGAEKFAHVGFFGADEVEEADGEGHGMTAWTPSHRRVFVVQTFSPDGLIILPSAGMLHQLAGGLVAEVELVVDEGGGEA